MVWTSLFGIITLVLLARALGFAKAPVLDAPDAARRIAGDAIPGFRAHDAVLARDRRAALVASSDGRVALVRSHGDRWVVRIVNGAEVAVAAGALRLTLPEAMFPAAVLDLGAAAPAWAARL
jgi:hypothetical protein